MATYDPAGVISMDLAIQREISYRKRRHDPSTESIHDFIHSLLPSDAPGTMPESILRESELCRKRLAEAAGKTVTVGRKTESIPMKIAMQREKACQKRTGKPVPESGCDCGSSKSNVSISTVSSYSDAAWREAVSENSGEEKWASEMANEMWKMGEQRVVSHFYPGESSTSEQGYALRPNLLRMKSQSFGRQQPPERQLKGLRCNLCLVSCGSLTSLQQHLQGKQHKAKQGELIQSSKKSGNKRTNIVTGNNCNRPFQWKQHEANHDQLNEGPKKKLEEGSDIVIGNNCTQPFQWKQHKANDGQLKEGPTKDLEGNNIVRCSVCQIPCSSMTSFRQHLVGKKHAGQLLTMFGLNEDGCNQVERNER